MLKRFTAFILAMIFVVIAACPAIGAIEYSPTAEESYATHGSSGVSYSCVYNDSTGKILISGTVTHDACITYKDHVIKLYKVGPLESFYEAISDPEMAPIASADISIRFNFSLNVVDTLDLFSKYVIVFVSAEGSFSYISDFFYPTVFSDYELDDKKDTFKGVIYGESTELASVSPATTIIDIDLNAIFNNGFSGYYYSMGDTGIFFDREYVKGIDTRIRALSTEGARVYLRLLVPTDTGYIMPNLNSEDEIRRMYACCDFLSERYSSFENGRLSGIILGSAVEDGFINSERYFELLALYGLIVNVAVRKNVPSADIVYPFSSNNFDGGEFRRTVIETLSAIFDERYREFDFSVMITSSHTPYGITNANLNKINLKYTDPTDVVTISGAEEFSDYLDELGKKYVSAPKSFIYYWEADEELNGSALCAAYAYSYYILYSVSGVSSFVADIDSSTAFADVKSIIRAIDTENSRSATDYYSEYFGTDGWSGVIEGYDKQGYSAREEYTVSALDVVPNDAKGEFYYYDFSKATKIAPWREGVGSVGLSIDYGASGDRALRAQFDTSELSNTDYAQLICVDQYPESYLHSPYLVFELMVEVADGDGLLYEIKIRIGNGRSFIECAKALSAGEREKIIIDTTEFSSKHPGEYISISVRPLSTEGDDFSLYLSSVVGVSTEYDDGELADCISLERLKTREEITDASDAADEKKDSGIVIIFVALFVMFGIMLFVFLKHDDSEETDKE